MTATARPAVGPSPGPDSLDGSPDPRRLPPRTGRGRTDRRETLPAATEAQPRNPTACVAACEARVVVTP